MIQIYGIHLHKVTLSFPYFRPCIHSLSRWLEGQEIEDWRATGDGNSEDTVCEEDGIGGSLLPGIVDEGVIWSSPPIVLQVSREEDEEDGGLGHKQARARYLPGCSFDSHLDGCRWDSCWIPHVFFVAVQDEVLGSPDWKQGLDLGLSRSFHACGDCTPDAVESGCCLSYRIQFTRGGTIREKQEQESDLISLIAIVMYTLLYVHVFCWRSIQ